MALKNDLLSIFMDLPDHIRKYIQTCLKPVEGFRINKNQKNKNEDCIIKIVSLRWVEYEKDFSIHGARWFKGMEEPTDRGGWEGGFIISVPKPKNKYCDMIYPYNKKCFSGIEIDKDNLIN